MNEYNEALSRLEAPERPFTPRYWKRIPFLPYPEHTSEEEYNRILAEARFSKLPKYSISQRFYITDLDLNMDVYNFDLDKSFVNASGDRKSIAIRNIHFDSMFKRGKLHLGGLEFRLQMPSNLKLWHNGTEYDIGGKTGTYSYGLADVSSLSNFFKTMGIGTSLAMNDIIRQIDGIDETLIQQIKDELRYNYDPELKTISIYSNSCHLNLDSVGFYKVNLMLFTDTDNITKQYVFNGITSTFTFRATTTSDTTKHNFDITFSMPNVLKDNIPAAVCSTINPYSCQNIIGSLDETHDMLNKIYPYDNQNSFALWFNDADGMRCMNKNITGYIDLELIIDNTNNLSLDV